MIEDFDSKKHTIEEDALEDWLFWSCMQKKGSLSDDLINQLACVLSFFSYRAVNFFFAYLFLFHSRGYGGHHCTIRAAQIDALLCQGRAIRATDYRTRSEEITFTARPKINSHFQIFRYGRSIFCLPHRPKFSDFFDLCLHWVSVVRDQSHRNASLFQLRFLPGRCPIFNILLNFIAVHHM